MLASLFYAWTSPFWVVSASAQRGFITADRARALVRAANGVMVDVAVVDETGPAYLTDAGTGSSALFPDAAAAHKTQAKFRTYSRAYSPASLTLFAAL